MALARGFRTACCSILLASLAWSQATPTTYQLEPEAGYVVGCFGSCACPVLHSQSLGGSLELAFIGSTPDWFDHYSLSSVDWLLVHAGRTIHVTGSGLYDIGGNPALLHRLRLDLSLDGGPTQSFDSGLIPGGTTFPRLDVLVSLNGMLCFDEVFEVRASPLDLGEAYCSSNPNSTGAAALLAATGSATVADNDFSLVATDAPPDRPGLFFFGQGPQQVPFGEGFLCISSAIQRVQPVLAVAPSGTAWRRLDLTQPPAVGLLTPGSSWSFQFWFRDPAGGPSGHNLTQGLQVGFL